jgi:hypothetical protein
MLDLELADRLEGMKAKTGMSIAEQIRRAIRFWLESQEWPVAKNVEFKVKNSEFNP